jgi:hypothetical protein
VEQCLPGGECKYKAPRTVYKLPSPLKESMDGGASSIRKVVIILIGGEEGEGGERGGRRRGGGELPQEAA